MKQKRKLISIVLALVLILGTTNVSAFALADEGLNRNETMLKDLFDLEQRGDLEDEDSLSISDDDEKETAKETYQNTDSFDGEDLLEDKEDLFTLDDNNLEVADAVEQESSKPTFIEAGNSNSFCIKEDKSVWSWGSNTYGSLGLGTTSTSYSPAEISNANFSVISNKGGHVLALKDDGTVWTWGRNTYGELGLGNPYSSSVPVLVSSLSKIIKISAGERHSLVLSDDGTVWSWGGNGYGQLGIGNTSNGYVPTNILNLNDIVDIAAGEGHSLALKTDGTVWSWGGNSSGELGIGSTVRSTTPVQVVNLVDIVAISAGYNYSLALKKDGTVWSWGNNDYGQLGDGTDGRYKSSSIPIQVKNLSGITAISAGESHNLALKDDGTLWTWGDNKDGKLGNDTTKLQNVAKKVIGLNKVNAISAGNTHSLILRKNGEVLSCGNNSYGQLGDGGTADNSLIPIKSQISPESTKIEEASYITFKQSKYEAFIRESGTFSVLVKANVYDDENDEIFDGITYSLNQSYAGIGIDRYTGEITIADEAKVGVLTVCARHGDVIKTVDLELKKITLEMEKTTITAGNDNCFYIKQEGNSTWGWGRGANGVLGTGKSATEYDPVEILIKDISMISNKGNHTIALGKNGMVWCWGSNGDGQLGIGNTLSSTTPISISNLNDIVKVTAGSTHSLALKSDGTVWSWGNNNSLQLGVEDTLKSTVPIYVTNTNGIVDIATGLNHNLALREDGTVWAWGSNSSDQLGAAIDTSKSIPVQIEGLSGIIAISAGSQHSLALKKDGTVWAWGSNTYEQLGDGTITRSLIPVQVKGLSEITAISAGNDHSLALKDDRTVWAWGGNINAQLGDGTRDIRTEPIKVVGLNGIKEISAGNKHNLALKKNGEVWFWGSNSSGQLGDHNDRNNIIYTPTKSVIKEEISNIGDAITIMFEKNQYEVFLSGQDYLTTSVKAIVCDSEGDEVTDEVNYSLNTVYPGVNIDHHTGVVTVTGGAEVGTAIICATYGNINQNVNLILRADEIKTSHNKIEAGADHSFSIADEKNAWRWGYSDYFDAGTSINSEPLNFKFENISMISNKKYHALILKKNGTVWAWGNNSSGQLGVSNVSKSSVPIYIPSLNGMIKVATGDGHSLALKEDGTVWAWGSNGNGQLGCLDTRSRSTPVEIPYLNGITDISARSSHSLALKEDGTVWAWGYNLKGQLGDGTSSNRIAPVQVVGLTDVIAISSGSYHNVALKEDGTVWAWGYNAYGQLGNGITNSGSKVPVQVNNLTGVVMISAGEDHTFALKEDGTVWAWGNNSYGQLGIGMTASSSNVTEAMNLIGLGRVEEISAGFNHSLAVKRNGEVWSWGANSYGQLGDGTKTSSYIPIKTLLVPKKTVVPSTIIFEKSKYEEFIPRENEIDLYINAKLYDEKGDEIFDDLNYSLDAEYPGVWINENTGKLTISDQAEIGEVIIHAIYGKLDQTVTLVLKKGTLPAFRSKIIAGKDNTFYIGRDKKTWGWGEGSDGAFGDGTTYQKKDPFEMPITNLLMISMRERHTLAVKDNGTVWAWGVNFYGELGMKGNTFSFTPVNLPSLNGTVKVAAGEYYSLALKEDRTVWAWGCNNNGRLGTGTALHSDVPIKVSDLYGIVDIAAGKKHSLALKEDGTVWAWGNNDEGQLGIGVPTDRAAPAQVNGLTNIIAISAGDDHSLALKRDGTVWAWGSNINGRLGNGEATHYSRIPVQVTGLTGVIEISAGGRHNLALRGDGTVWAWGNNTDGQLGNGQRISSNQAIKVDGVSDVKEISAGDMHSFALKNNGELWAWGNNYYRQLGDGTTEFTSLVPVRCIALSALEEAVQPSYVKFQKNEYETFIPKAGDISVSITAKVYGDDHDVMTAEISYALDKDYPGVSIDNRTGAVTITDKAIAGIVVVHARYGDLVGSANLVLKKAIPPISAQRIEAGKDSAFYIKEDRHVQGWGSGVYGALGIDLSDAQYESTKIPITDASMVSAKGEHVLALKENGTVWSWGSNGHGQLGLGHLSDSKVPTNISGLKEIVKVVTGKNHSLALKNDGNLWSWGDNQYGQLGTGSVTESSKPINISSLNGVMDVTARENQSMALREDGTVWVWGTQGNQLMTSMIPVQVENLTGIIAISAGASHSLALTSDGTVWAWGDNDDRQLGNGTTAASISPVQVKGLTNVVAVSAGTNHSLALKRDGTVWAWGNNAYGQLGNGTNDENWGVVKCQGLTGITAVSAGHNFSLALNDQETVWAWGTNEKGQLGDGTNHPSFIPVKSQTDLEIAFADRTYSVEIPEAGIVKMMVKAQVFHGNNEIVSGREVIYGLESAYEGVSIDSTTGEVTVEAGAKWGTVVLTASSGGLHCKVGLVLTRFNTITPLENTIHIDAIAGSTYDVSVYVKDIPRNNGMNIVVQYDQTVFEVMDLCRFTEGKELEACQINEAGLTFTHVVPGEIRFAVNKDIPNGKLWSGIVNIVGLRAKASGSSEIKISN